MNKILSYITGGFALLLVATATVSAIVYAGAHNMETLQSLATSTLQGIGMSIGGCLGGALVMRFKIARKFVKGVVDDIKLPAIKK